MMNIVIMILIVMVIITILVTTVVNTHFLTFILIDAFQPLHVSNNFIQFSFDKKSIIAETKQVDVRLTRCYAI